MVMNTNDFKCFGHMVQTSICMYYIKLPYVNKVLWIAINFKTLSSKYSDSNPGKVENLAHVCLPALK